jgi:hypothetical protein
MNKSLAAATLLIGFAISGAAAQPITEGTAFPLASDDATPTFMRFEVHHISSDNTVDVAVWLNPPAQLPRSQTQLLTQLGEFCLRYYDGILEATVEAEERARIYVFVPLYTIPIPGGDPKRFEQQGFAFKQRDGKCSLEAPFPANLVRTVEERAREPLPGN